MAFLSLKLKSKVEVYKNMLQHATQHADDVLTAAYGALLTCLKCGISNIGLLTNDRFEAKLNSSGSVQKFGTD